MFEPIFHLPSAPAMAALQAPPRSPLGSINRHRDSLGLLHSAAKPVKQARDAEGQPRQLHQRREALALLEKAHPVLPRRSIARRWLHRARACAGVGARGLRGRGRAPRTRGSSRCSASVVSRSQSVRESGSGKGAPDAPTPVQFSAHARRHRAILSPPHTHRDHHPLHSDHRTLTTRTTAPQQAHGRILHGTLTARLIFLFHVSACMCQATIEKKMRPRKRARAPREHQVRPEAPV